MTTGDGDRPLTIDELRLAISDLRHTREDATESLKELTEARFVTYKALLDGNAEKVALALAAADKAVTKAEVATEKRFEGVNEFRKQLADQTGTFMPRVEASQRMDALVKEIDQLKTDLGKIREASANLAGRMTMIGAIITVLITFVVLAANIAFR